MSEKAEVIKVKPNHYVFITDVNKNVTRTITGPATLTRKDHERLADGPKPMITIGQRQYAVIANPVMRGPDGEPLLAESGQARLRYGEDEVRFAQPPFPLHPGERVTKLENLRVVPPNQALRIRAVRDYQPEDGPLRNAGDEWMFIGPGTYKPRVEEEIATVVKATIIQPNQALRLRALRACTDYKNHPRKAGEEWLVKREGAFLPSVEIEVVGTVQAIVLTDKKALHLRATKTFIDRMNQKRKAGEEWLVTIDMAESHIPDVYETVVGTIAVTTLTNRQFCVVINPCDANGRPKMGARELRVGECSFFLRPGERLEKGIQSVYVLGEEEALLLRAQEGFEDTVQGHKVQRRPGDRWMIHGPCDYVPPVMVEILERRKSIPLDENEGVYVRNLHSGEIRAVSGQSYLLKPNEELYAIQLDPMVEELIATRRDPMAERSADAPRREVPNRDKTRLVSYRAPHNSAVQIFDYKLKKSRVVYGPDLVMLGPDEQFTLLSISGGTPKREGQIKSIAMLLGPDFMTDVVTVETSDHARLALKLAYSWQFEVNKEDPSHAEAIFSIPDFVGDTCKAIASRVRGTVAGVSFDDFHKHSSDIIRKAVFGVDSKTGEVKPVMFKQLNRLAVRNVDIQSVEPVDQKTRESLQKSVQLAIEITTAAQEATARQEHDRLDQVHRGLTERQHIADETTAEKMRIKLLELQAKSAAVESTGQAKAEAEARAQSAEIEGKGKVRQAELRAHAQTIKAQAELIQLKQEQEHDLQYTTAQVELETKKAREYAEIEAKKIQEMVDAIGRETLKSMARAGPEMQAKLLAGLGMKSTLITDGTSPINLFNTAQGLIGAGGGARSEGSI